MKSLFQVNYYKPTETLTIMIKNTILTNILYQREVVFFMYPMITFGGLPLASIIY